MTTYRMTMTAGRRQVFARQARARFDRGEAELKPIIKHAIDEYLAVLRGKLDTLSAKQLVAAISSDSAKDIGNPLPVEPTYTGGNVNRPNVEIIRNKSAIDEIKAQLTELYGRGSPMLAAFSNESADSFELVVMRDPRTGETLGVTGFTFSSDGKTLLLGNMGISDTPDPALAKLMIDKIREDNPTLPMKAMSPIPIDLYKQLGAKFPSPDEATWLAWDKSQETELQKDSVDHIAEKFQDKAKWGELLDAEIMPAIGRHVDGVIGPSMSRSGVADTLIDWRREWLAQRRQELVDIPDDITEQLRTRLSDLAEEFGTTVEDAAEAAQEMLDDGYASWDGRADLIARTETVGANNQGSLAAMSAVAEAEGMRGTKTWLATSDNKTRPDHAEVDGTTVALDEDFTVGDVTMNGPGDNKGGASQVCNCRCTLTYDFSDADVSLDSDAEGLSTDGDNPGDIGTADADLTAAGDFAEEKHPRDAHGRFGSGSGGDEAAQAQPEQHGADPLPHELSGTEASQLLTEAQAGGFTYSVAGKTSPKTGYSVSPYPERSLVVDTKDLNADVISKYADDNRDVLSEPGHHLGGWREQKDDGTDRVWLDVSIVDRSQKAAEATAQKFNQVAIFDLGSGNTIDTGGTGHVTASLTRQADPARSGRPTRGSPQGSDPGAAGRSTQGRQAGEAQGHTAGDASRHAVTAAAGTPPKGVAVMAYLASSDAQRCAVEGGEAPEDMHVTLAYLAKDAADYTDEERSSIMSALADNCGGILPISASAFATAHFNQDDPEREPCVVLLVQSDELAALKATVDDGLAQALVDQSDSFPTWIPHVTVGYNIDPASVPDGVPSSDVTFDRLVLGWAGDHVQVDPAADTGPDAMTAATEAPVTAPAPTDVLPAEATPAAALDPNGITWSGWLADLDYPSSDNRAIYSGGGQFRPLPRPLSWQRESSEGHEGSVVVGRILVGDIRPNPETGRLGVWGEGDYLDPSINFDVAQAMAQVDAGVGFISVDLAVQAIGYADAATGVPIDPVLYDGDTDIIELAMEWEIGGATIVSFEAFANAKITNQVPDVPGVTADPILEVEPMDGATSFAAANPAAPTIADDGSSVTLTDGTTVAVGDTVGIASSNGTTESGTITAIDVEAATVTVQPDPADDGTAAEPITVAVADLVPAPADAGIDGMEGGEAALLASAAVRPFTRSFFNKRNLPGPTPLTVNPETGEVFGHAAEYGTCHLGYLAEGRCVTPPENEDFSYFHLTPVPMDDGGDLEIGKITLGTGHAKRGSFRYALSHYENTGTQAAVVRAYKDEYGIQVAGQLIHDLPVAKVEELMRSPLSGDWRKINGEFKFTAALAVNNPGFPVRRRPAPVMGMNATGTEQISLVAAGVVWPDTGTTINEITLPSGKTIATSDFEALTAAMVEVVERQRRAVSPEDELALRRARVRLELAGARSA